MTDPKLLEHVAETIVGQFRPRRIILFCRQRT